MLGKTKFRSKASPDDSLATGPIEAAFFERRLDGFLHELDALPVRHVPNAGDYVYLGDDETTLGPYEVIRVVHSLCRSGDEVHQRCDVLMSNIATETLLSMNSVGEA